MTKEQIKQTIFNLNTTDDMKKEIQKQCDEGNPNMLFVINAKRKKQQHGQ